MTRKVAPSKSHDSLICIVLHTPSTIEVRNRMELSKLLIFWDFSARSVRYGIIGPKGDSEENELKNRFAKRSPEPPPPGENFDRISGSTRRAKFFLVTRFRLRLSVPA